MPTNAKMPALRAAFEAAGFTNVVSVLGSGNIVFDARSAPESTLERKAEAAMQQQLGRVFLPFVRSVTALEALLASDPYARFKLAPDVKRVVTFLRTPLDSSTKLPDEIEGARIVAINGREMFTTYTRGANTPVFMQLIARQVGKEQTTRSWETIQRCVRA